MPAQHPEPFALQRRGLVKVCGLREPAHALVAAGCGADLLSLMFAPSRRKVTVEQASGIVEAVRDAYGDRSPLFAGVFVDFDSATINSIASVVGLDAVQLHGPEDSGQIREIALPVIRAFGPPPESTVDGVVTMLQANQTSGHVPALFLMDAYAPDHHGGTGNRADWALARGVAARMALMLAGGLDPGNVADAIYQVRPRGVDVSSGVETDGIKDPRKIRAFVANAKQAFAELDVTLMKEGSLAAAAQPAVEK